MQVLQCSLLACIFAGVVADLPCAIIFIAYQKDPPTTSSYDIDPHDDEPNEEEGDRDTMKGRKETKQQTLALHLLLSFTLLGFIILLFSFFF